MRKVTAKMMVAVMLSTSLVASYPYSAHAVQSASPVVNTHLSKPLSIEGKGTIELKTIFSVPNQEGQVVTFSFDIVNQSQEILDFSNYWIRLKSKTGSRYPIKIVDDPSKSRIFPGQKQTLVFYATLPKNVKLADLQPRFIKWDTTTVNFERELGIFPINGNIIPTLGRSVSKFIGLTNNQLEARVAQGEIKREEEDDGSHTTINYTLKLLNKGQQSITLPEYQYILVTDTGVSYPLNVVSTENEQGEQNQILPWIEKQIELQGVVPNTVDLSKVTLYILYPQGDDKGKTMIPVTLFKVFEKPTDQKTSDVINKGVEKVITLKNNGKAKVILKDIKRLPWITEDHILAEIYIENLGEGNITLPELEGTLILDKNYSFNVSITSEIKDNILRPKSSGMLTVVGKIPYDSFFFNGQLSFKEKSTDNKVLVSAFPSFAFDSDGLKPGKYSEKERYEFGDTGKRNGITLIETQMFRKWNMNIIASYIEVKNLESRSASLPKLAGFFKTKDGNLYPAKIEEYYDTNLPRGTSVVTVWSEIPLEMEKEDIELIVGELANEDGMKNGARFGTYIRSYTPPKNLETIELYPFTLHFTDWKAEDKKDGNLRFTFKYDWVKLPDLIPNSKSRSIVMEFTDEYGNVLKTETFTLEDQGKWESGHKEILVPVDYTEFESENVKVNLYEKFKDGLRQLGTLNLELY